MIDGQKNVLKLKKFRHSLKSLGSKDGLNRELEVVANPMQFYAYLV